MPLQHGNPEGDTDKAAFNSQNPFTIEAITALYSSVFAKGFSNNQRQAAIRALLRHGAHEDGSHYHTRSTGGLHPAYAGFNPINKTENKVLSRTDLVEASLDDVFDAVSMFIHIAHLTAHALY